MIANFGASDPVRMIGMCDLADQSVWRTLLRSFLWPQQQRWSRSEACNKFKEKQEKNAKKRGDFLNPDGSFYTLLLGKWVTCSLPTDVSIHFIDSVPKLEVAVTEMLKEAVLGWDSEYSHGNSVFCTASLIQVAGQKTM